MKFLSTYKKCLLLLLFLLTATNSLFSQQHYPVHATVQVLRPHGLHLSDYYSGTRDRLVVTLLNRDFGQPTLNVRLRVTVRNGNHFMMRSRDELPAPVLTLMHGVPLRLTGADLAPYLMPNRVHLQGHLQNGKLPTGNTDFIVEVLDHATGRVLSQAATGSAWLELHQPPMPDTPAQGAEITFRTPQHVRFQWYPRHMPIAQTVYEFTLRELPNNDIPPQQAFLFGNTIYQTTTRVTTLNLTHLQPLLEPGRRYAWQIRAITVDGIDEIGTFANNGFSEISWFKVVEPCPPPMNVRGEATGNRAMTIRWQPQHQHQSFIVKYRVKSYQGYDVFPWHSIEVWGNETTITELTPRWTYLFRVGALCPTSREPVFSDIGEVTLPAHDPERLARCGQSHTPEPIDNQEPIDHLQVGDIVRISRGVPMRLLEVTPLGNGWFSGRGVALPVLFLEEVGLAVRFDNLRVNTDLLQIDGSVRAEYDPNWSRIADVNITNRGGNPTTPGGVVFPTVRLDFTVPPMLVMTYNPETGNLTVLDVNGTPRTIQVPRNEQGEPTFPIVVEDADGQRFKVDLPEGSEGDIAAGRTVTPVVTPIRDLAPGSFNTAALDDNAGVVVRFSRGNGRFGFDDGGLFRDAQSPTVRDFYPLWGTNYIAPWKLIPVGENDVVTATIETGNADPNNIFFVLADGTGVPTREENGRWILTLPSTGHSQHYAVFAVYRRGGNNMSVGRLNVVSYRPVQHTVVLVEVNAQVPQSREQIERELNAIFNQYGVTITVRVENSFYGNTEWDRALNISGSAFFTTETRDMRELRRAFQRTDAYTPGGYYIFILREANAEGEPSESVIGDMPRGNQFGFVFMDALNTAQIPLSWLIAHELGHGIFTLQHTFREHLLGSGSIRGTSNLMDYNRGTELAAFQWNEMSSPARITRFDSEEEGQAREIGDELWIAQMIENIRCNRLSGNYNMSVQGMEGLRRIAPSLNSPFFNDEVNYLGAAIWVREVMGDNVDVRSITRSGNRIIVGRRPNAITLEITTPFGARIHTAEELTEFLFQYLTVDESTFEQQSQRAIGGIFADDVSLFRANNLHQCVLPKLNNEQRMILLNSISRVGQGSPYHLLAIRIMANIPQEQISDMFKLLAGSDIFYRLKDRMRPVDYNRFVYAALRTFLQQTDISERLHNAPPEKRFEWNQGRRNYMSYSLSIEGNRLNIVGIELMERIVPVPGQRPLREQVNMTDLLAIRAVTSLGNNIPGDGRFYPIPAFYFDLLVTNYERGQAMEAIDFAVNFIPLGATVSQFRNVVRAGRWIYATYLATGAVINTYNLLEITVSLNTHLEERAETDERVRNMLAFFNILDRYYPLSELAVSRIVTGQPVQILTDFTVAWSLSRNIIREELGITNSSQVVNEIMDTLQSFVDEINNELN